MTNAGLPDAWVDSLNFMNPKNLWFFVRKVFLRQDIGRVVLPEGLQLRVPLPKYVLLEFHNLPNGNYSKRITEGYSVNFDRWMLGEMQRGQQALAKQFAGRKHVLDVGCGAGNSTAALTAAGISDVTGLDASPYLLWHASRRFPTLKFIQGLAEDTRLESGSLDGVSACFVFHELPGKSADAALKEFHRLLEPGGRLAILEPAAEQFSASSWQLFKRFGWRGLYFQILARMVHEPFVKGWHARLVKPWLEAHGFRLDEEQLLFPSRLLVATKV